MSKISVLGSGQITAADTLSVELVKPPDTPAVVMIRWPQAPSVAPPTPKAIADIATALVRILAQAQARLARDIDPKARRK